MENLNTKYFCPACGQRFFSDFSFGVHICLDHKKAYIDQEVWIKNLPGSVFEIAESLIIADYGIRR